MNPAKNYADDIGSTVSQGMLYNKATKYQPTRQKKKRGQTAIKAGVALLYRPQVFGYARWRGDWVKVSSELAQDHRAWGASVRDVVNSIGATGSTRSGRMSTQVSK